MTATIFNRKGLIQLVIFNIGLYTKEYPDNHVINLDSLLIDRLNCDNVEQISTRQWSRLRNDVLREIEKNNLQNKNAIKLNSKTKNTQIDIKRIELCKKI